MSKMKRLASMFLAGVAAVAVVGCTKGEDKNKQLQDAADQKAKGKGAAVVTPASEPSTMQSMVDKTRETGNNAVDKTKEGVNKMGQGLENMGEKMKGATTKPSGM